MHTKVQEFIIVSLVTIQIVKGIEDKWVWAGRRSSGSSHLQGHPPGSRESLEFDRKGEDDYGEDSRQVKQFKFNGPVNSVQNFVQSKYQRDFPYSNYKYEVNEEYNNDFKPPVYRPAVPFAVPNRPIPEVSKPAILPFGPRPVGLPSRPNPALAGSQPQPSNVGILTGPVPSWENAHNTHKNGDPTQFERCKCLYSFNCKAPGIQFGNCDTGKQYCCYNSKNAQQTSGFGSHLDVDRTDSDFRLPAILAGPGGPVDHYPESGTGGPIDYPDHSVPPFSNPYEDIQHIVLSFMASLMENFASPLLLYSF